MIVLFSFLSGISFVIACAACLAAHREQERAQSAERALHANLTEQCDVMMKLAKQDLELEALMRSLAAASFPPAVPVGQVQIVVPGPRTLQ